MKYDYIQYLIKNINVQHSEILHDDAILGGQKVIVYFENTETHVKGKAVLPTYEWLDKGQLSKNDIDFCNKVLHWNVTDIFKYAKEGGIKIPFP